MNITTSFALQSKGAQLRVSAQCAEGYNWCTGFAPLSTLCSKSFKLYHHWSHNSRLQVDAICSNYHTELVPVHSPLLRQSSLVSYAQPTYMLRFSLLIDLSSCLEVTQTVGHIAYMKPHLPLRNVQQDANLVLLWARSTAQTMSMRKSSLTRDRTKTFLFTV